LSLATVNSPLPPLVTTYQNKLETYFGHTCHICGVAAPLSTLILALNKQLHCELHFFNTLCTILIHQTPLSGDNLVLEQD